MNSVWIVTPTYNERENIRTHISGLRATVPQATLLVVDDSSPDGTGAVVDELATGDAQVRVLHRQQKAGLGLAYMEGLRMALAAGATQIVHLDADGSHPIDLIPSLLAALETADLAIGSRYVQGGSMHIDIFRRQVSNLGNIYIRSLLGRAIHDWSTGFKAWRRASLEGVLAVPPRAHGYAWLMETSWLAVRAGARVTEIPLVFQSRQRGESKFSLTIAKEDLQVAWRLARGRTLAE